ncbi:TIGR02678 family protein [Cupriavidus basilensis]
MTEEDLEDLPESAGQRLAERQQAHQREEFRIALRGLLMTPLMQPDHEAFPAVRRQQAALRDWLSRETGWVLKVSRSGARLNKLPAELNNATRGLPGYSRYRYALLCLTGAVLVSTQSQITLQIICDKLTRRAEEPAMASCGFRFDLTTRHDRLHLVHVCRTFLSIGVLARVHGDEERFVNEENADVLYDVNRWMLAELLAAVRGPSTWLRADAPISVADRIHSLVRDFSFDTEDARRTAIRHHIARRLLDDPVVYAATLDGETSSYFTNQRGPMAARLSEATGMTAELRAEGVALVDEPGLMTDVQIRGNGTHGHVTMLVAEYLRARHFTVAKTAAGHSNTTAMFTYARDVGAFIRRAALEHGKLWRKDAREPGAEESLAEMAICRLEQLNLVEWRGGGIYPLPALARFKLGSTEVTKKSRSRRE